MKKTQPIDWDRIIFDEVNYPYENHIEVFDMDSLDSIFISQDFIAAFDEMLEYYLENRLERLFCKWDDKQGWIPDVNKHKWKA